MQPGEELKEIRTRLGITTRDVAERSEKIAEQEKNTEFLISSSWLSQLETHPKTLPGVHKLFTLACVYHVTHASLLELYGMGPQKIAVYQDQMPIQKTHLIPVAASEEQTTVELPLRFDSGLNLNKTRHPNQAHSAPNLIGPFISSTSGPSMLVLGASCMKASCSWFRIRFRLANIGCSHFAKRLRSLAK